jgi:hypothetical protein
MLTTVPIFFICFTNFINQHAMYNNDILLLFITNDIKFNLTIYWVRVDRVVNKYE